MASTYSNLKIQLMTTGENLSTWGTVTNTNLGTAIEQAMVETATVDLSSGDVTLSLSNTNAAQDARAFRLNCTGATAARNVIVPAIQKPYIVNNGGSYAVTVKVSGQTGVTVPAGRSMFLYNNGTDVVNALDGISVVSGGTGTNTLTANNVILGNGTSAVQFVAPGTAGNVLTSNGSTWTSGAGFVTGMIILWSGSVASIPSGWALCNGSNGTPDLRDKFVVGAGSTYAVGATGGSADAIVVSHTHTATSTVIDPGHTHTYDQSTTNGGALDIYFTNNGASGTLTTASNVTGITVGTTISTTGSSGTNANLPPYYALAYIMKL